MAVAHKYPVSDLGIWEISLIYQLNILPDCIKWVSKHTETIISKQIVAFFSGS